MLVPMSASALATYSYTGLNFTFIFDNTPPAGTFTGADSVSGSFDLAVPLGPSFALSDISGSVLSYSFTDGRSIFTDGGSAITNFDVETDGSGAISDWVLSFEIGVPATMVGDTTRALGTQFTSDFGNVSECTAASGGNCTTFSADNGIVNVVGGGTWTFVPEPTTASLLGLGLAGLAVQRRRRAA
jgi:hypothetical protein